LIHDQAIDSERHGSIPEMRSQTALHHYFQRTTAMQNGVMSFQEFTHAPTRSVMNQMTTNFRNFIGPLRVEFVISTLYIKKGPKISETGAKNYLCSEKQFLRLNTL